MNFPSVSQFSISKGTGGTNPPEMYIPLWWYSGSYVTTNGSLSGNTLLSKGSTYVTTNSTTRLHTLNSNWSPTQKFALEVAMYTNVSGSNGYAALYDCTSSTVVGSSQVSTTSTSMTVFRSPQFTLTTGHVYGVAIWGSGSNYIDVTDTSLIVFPS